MSNYSELDLSGFGYRELGTLAELLNLYSDRKLSRVASERFGDLKTAGFNSNSGYVFLLDENYNCLMENDGELDLFISTPYEGKEGFLYELLNEYTPDDLHREDVEYIRELLEDYSEDIPTAWADDEPEEEEEEEEGI